MAPVSHFRSVARLSALRRLDFLPALVALCGGTALGLGAWAMVAEGGLWAQAAGLLALAGVAWWLAASAEPVAVEVQEELEEIEAFVEVVEESVPPSPRPSPEAWAEKRRELARWLEVVPLSGGVFRMGSPEEEEGRSSSESPLHPARVSAFSCQRFPVTRALYAAVIGSDPGWPEGDADERPVNNVSWFDAVRFCNRLSELEGLLPCYEISEEPEVVWRREAGGYRLPTEAEWEYACRAGTQTRWSFGDDEAELDRHAWFDRNAGNRPQPVGQREPNPWGLHDLHGNVWEWCWDRFGDYPPEAGARSRRSGRPEGRGRVLRGGSFFDTSRFLRSAYRFGIQPGDVYKYIGFRCVLRAPRRP